jgi:hypothetical protein
MAVRIPLLGYAPEMVLSGAGCGTTASVAIALPSDASGVRPFEGFANPDGSRSGGYRLGDPVPGPVGFGGEDSPPPAPDYASVTAFGATPSDKKLMARFVVSPSTRWCSGYFTDSTGGPVPASSAGDATVQPGYHPGWSTAPTGFIVRFVLHRGALYTLDAKGVLRARPPARMAVSRRHRLVATGLRWRNWGQRSAVAHGTLHYRGRKLVVNVEFLNAELQPLSGCPNSQVFYKEFAVSVPAWHVKTTYGVAHGCSTSIVNNSAGDLRPPN